MVSQYIGVRTILDLFKEMVRRSGAWAARIWWDQGGLNLSGARVATSAAEGG